MIERVCKAPFEYAGVKRKPGDRFEVEPVHLTMLIASGHIERDESDVAPAYVPRDMAANWPSGYSTRAMTASRRGAHRKAA